MPLLWLTHVFAPPADKRVVQTGQCDPRLLTRCCCWGPTLQVVRGAASACITQEFWAILLLMESLAELGAPDVLPNMRLETPWLPTREDLLEVLGRLNALWGLGVGHGIQVGAEHRERSAGRRVRGGAGLVGWMSRVARPAGGGGAVWG